MPRYSDSHAAQGRGLISLEGNCKGGRDSDAYLQFTGRKVLVLLFMGLVIIVVSIFSIASGVYSISPADVIEVLFGGGSTMERTVVWSVRAPRIAAALIVGSALGVSGTVMQCVLKNPLASPYTLGISSAAAFGAAFSLAASYFGLFSSGLVGEVLGGIYGMAISAFVWSMVAVMVTVSLSKLVSTTPESMILTGVALGAIFSSALSSLQYFVDDTTLASMVYWQFGDLSKVNTIKLGIMAAATLITSIYFVHKRWDYNAMEVGDDVSRSLGIDTKRTLIFTMVLSSGVTAICISMVGIIGFVGLMAPHFMRRVIGGDHRFLIPGSMLMGASILLIADSIGRLAFVISFPVGIITSFLGGPLFILILSRERRKTEG
ncbi:MAG: iron ABC transporter permease [Euryarchaeota archaeon]|nr:iron ABC transporter permease [Euryarchaeota archaeon]